MNWLRDRLRRVQIRLFGNGTIDELDEELRDHIARQVEHNIAKGMTIDEARRQATIEFGGVEKAREEVREQRQVVVFETLSQDVRYALRGLRRSPAFAIATILTFAIGIGATTAVFSVVDRILFRSLPYRDAWQLVSIGVVAPVEPQEFMLGYSYYEWQDHQTPFTAITSWTGVNTCDLTENNALRLSCASVEANFLPTFGVTPLLGRNFSADEDRPNAPRVALISYGLWRSRFGRDPSIINRTISIDGNPVRVIGVLNQDFQFPTLDTADILAPEGIDPASQRAANPGRVRWAFARLKPGITIAQATARMEPLFQQMLETVPPQFRKEVRLRVRSLRDRQVHDAKLAAWILLVAVVSVLLIACANVASLLLARGASRQREMAVRSALGASRARLIRQTLTESLLLALIATTVGCIIAAVLIRIFVAVAPEGIPFLANAHIDTRVIVFAVLASLLCGTLFGIAPALQRPNAESLAGRSNLAVPHSKLRQILVMAQIAVSLVLLAGAGLLLRSLRNLQSQPLGMHTNSLVTSAIDLGTEGYPKPEQQMAFFLQLESRLRKLPGVNAVALSDSLPPGGWRHDQIYAGIRVEGKPLPAEGTGGLIVWRWVTPDYFRALGIPIGQGRAFREDDRESSDHFIIVSQSLAKRMFPGEDPIGRHLQPGLEGPWYTIVGVAAEVKNGGLTGESEPEYYRLRRNRAEDWQHSARLTVQTAIASATTEQWIRSQVAALDPTLPVETETMTQRVSKLADRPRFEAALLGLFASIGVLLAAMGIYGVIAFLVTQRTQEIGLRMALGATRRDILRLFGMQGLRMIAVGGVLGVLLALTGLRALSSLLFGVRAADPLSFVIVCLLLIAVATLAIWIPARKATQVEPMQALRNE